MSMMEEKQTSHVGKRTSLSETYEELCLILRDGFDGQVLIHEHLLFQKNGGVVTVRPVLRSVG